MPITWIDSSRPLALEQLRDERASNVIFGVGMHNEFLLSACKKIGISVVAICDNYHSLSKNSVFNLPLLTPQAACKLPGKVNFIISMLYEPYIREALTQLSDLGIPECYNALLMRAAYASDAQPPYQVEKYGFVHGQWRPDAPSIVASLPPKWDEVPPDMAEQFTMNGRLPVIADYADLRVSIPLFIPKGEYEHMFSLFETKSFSYYYNSMNFFMMP